MDWAFKEMRGQRKESFEIHQGSDCTRQASHACLAFRSESTNQALEKTLMGPAYGSPIEQTQVLPVRSTAELQKRYLLFINRDKVGLQILPVDGNPHKTSAIVCHPNGVAGIAVSYDGRYAFTAGGHDRSVVQWKITLSVLEAAVSLGGEDLTPFYGLLSGGREGKFYRELEDYFYYSQLRSQGIDTMETRKVSEYICLSEIPFVMRAIGFYPSEEKTQCSCWLRTLEQYKLGSQSLLSASVAYSESPVLWAPGTQNSFLEKLVIRAP
ncbi:hypothetical protein H8959_015225 [Pygathrix nigripes]